MFLTHALASARAEPGLRQQPAVNKALHTLANEGRLRFQVGRSSATNEPCACSKYVCIFDMWLPVSKRKQ